MSVRTQQLVQGMTKAAAVVRNFGAAAATPLKFAGGAMGQLAVESARVAGAMGRMGRAGMKGTIAGFRVLGGVAGKAIGGVRAGINALGGTQAKVGALAA